MKQGETYNSDDLALDQQNARARSLDRRSVLASLGLVAGGFALGLTNPLPAHAKTSARNRRIFYHLNGGAHPAGQVKSVKLGSSIPASKLKTPKRKGYRFSGWYSNKKLTKRVTRVYGTAGKSRRTVYAKWKPRRYSITYKLNGGKATRKLPTSYTIESKRIVPYPPSRRGHLFKGWYADSKYKRSKPFIKAGSTGNVKLYAKWQAIKYKISYKLGGGKEVLPLPKQYTVNSSTVTLFRPTRSGHRFLGWYSDAAFKRAKSTIPTGSTGNVTFYAKWTPTDYWNEHMDLKVARINKRNATVANGMPSFVFLTDPHLPKNAIVFPDLVTRIMKRTNTNMIVTGGDIIDTPVDKNKALAMLKFMRRVFGTSNIHMVRGNHDGNNEGSSSRTISDAQYIQATQSPAEIRPAGKVYSYRDDTRHKVRFIFLDSGAPSSHYMDAAQLTWLEDRVLELGEGWTVLVFIHYYYKKVYRSGGKQHAILGKNGKLLKATLDKLYDEAPATIAGVLCGHCHMDYIERASKGYAIVSTSCDRYDLKAPAPDRKLGTTQEQAFDVVSIDTEKKNLYLTRVGFGYNRKVSFGPDVEEPVIEEPDVVDETEPAQDEVPAEDANVPVEAVPVDNGGAQDGDGTQDAGGLQDSDGLQAGTVESA